MSQLRFLIAIQTPPTWEWVRLPQAIPAPSRELALLAVQKATGLSMDMIRIDGMTTATGPTIRELLVEAALDAYAAQNLEPQYMAVRLYVDGVVEDMDVAALHVLRRYP